MVNSKKVIAGLGVVAGLGVAMLPLTTFADEVSDTTEGNVVRVKVSDTIAVTVTETYAESNAISVNQGEQNVAGLTHAVKVKGNTRNDYTLSVYAGSAGTALKHTAKDTNTIPTLAEDSETLSAGSWGYQFSTAAGGSTYNGTWKPVQASANADAIIHGANGVKDAPYEETWNVKYGVKAAENQLSGTYEATVIYKAAATAI